MALIAASDVYRKVRGHAFADSVIGRRNSIGMVASAINVQKNWRNHVESPSAPDIRAGEPT